MNSIYHQLKREYRKVGFLNYIYFLIRWRLVDFEKIEQLVSKDGYILDFGCGIGILSNLLALKSQDRIVFGCDTNKNSLKKAKKASQNIINIKFGTDDNLDKIDKKFKNIILIDVLHHIPYKKQEKVLMNLKRKLDVDGRLIIQDIDKGSFPKYLLGYLVDAVRCGKNNIFYHNKNEFIALLEKIGFKVKISSKDNIAHLTLIAYE